MNRIQARRQRDGQGFLLAAEAGPGAPRRQGRQEADCDLQGAYRATWKGEGKGPADACRETRLLCCFFVLGSFTATAVPAYVRDVPQFRSWGCCVYLRTANAPSQPTRRARSLRGRVSSPVPLSTRNGRELHKLSTPPRAPPARLLCSCGRFVCGVRSVLRTQATAAVLTSCRSAYVAHIALCPDARDANHAAVFHHPIARHELLSKSPPFSLVLWKIGVGVGGGRAAGASPLSFFLPRPQASAESKAAAYQEVSERGREGGRQ